jgi:hypothetical protein
MTLSPKQRRERFSAKHPKYGSSRHRERKFGLSPIAFQQMVEEQGDRCFLCTKPERGHRNGVRKALAVDHNRTTGSIRKLLCSKCNTAIGLLNEDTELLAQVIHYLDSYR